MAKALGVRPEAFADCRWRTFQEVIHLLFQLEGDEGIVPAPGESAIEAGKPSSAIELALIDWGEKRAELDAGEITQEEYEDWKDSYSSWEEGSVGEPMRFRLDVHMQHLLLAELLPDFSRL